jgi:hypothetical protein
MGFNDYFSICELFLPHHCLLVESFEDLTALFRWRLLIDDLWWLLETNSTLAPLKFFLEYLFGVRINLWLMVLP